MSSKLHTTVKKISHGKLGSFIKTAYSCVNEIELVFFRLKWFLQGARKPKQEEIDLVCKNVTFLYKSFERKKMAKRLYRNIQAYYPGVRVVIADDSKEPLTIENAGEQLKIVHLPFNSGLCRGLNAALKEVETPFVMRMDDDELLTPLSKIGEEVKFLQKHHEVDLVGLIPVTTIKCKSFKTLAHTYYDQTFSYVKKPLVIPHLTPIDEKHIVVAKPANIFLARTEQVRKIGWDDKIRMLDHNEFFVRATGNLVSVINPQTVIWHYHNLFDTHYLQYRDDFQGDRNYIAWKMMRENLTK